MAHRTENFYVAYIHSRDFRFSRRCSGDLRFSGIRPLQLLFPKFSVRLLVNKIKRKVIKDYAVLMTDHKVY